MSNYRKFYKAGNNMLTLTLSDEIVESIKLPKRQIEKEIKKELGFILYERGFTSIGVSRKLSGLSKWEFIEGLAERGIERHYEERDIIEDIEYATGCK